MVRRRRSPLNPSARSSVCSRFAPEVSQVLLGAARRAAFSRSKACGGGGRSSQAEKPLRETLRTRALAFTGNSNRPCFLNAYLAAIPWQSTPSPFLSDRAPGEPRPNPCAMASAQLPSAPVRALRCRRRLPPLSASYPVLRSPSARTAVSPPPRERPCARIPFTASARNSGGYACVRSIPPHGVSLTHQECPFLSG